MIKIPQVILIGCIPLLGLALASCNRVAMVVMGVKQPKTETNETILAFAAGQNFPIENTFVLKNADFYNSDSKQKLFSPTDSVSKPAFAIPGLLAFNAEGKAFNFYNPAKCYPGVLGSVRWLQLNNPNQRLSTEALPVSLQNSSTALRSNVSAQDSLKYQITADLPEFLPYFTSLNNSQLSIDSVLDGSDVYIAFF